MRKESEAGSADFEILHISSAYSQSKESRGDCLYLPDICSFAGFNIFAWNMENLKIQPFEQTLMQEGDELEA